MVTENVNIAFQSTGIPVKLIVLAMLLTELLVDSFFFKELSSLLVVSV
jgi:hypothetical protein